MFLRTNILLSGHFKIFLFGWSLIGYPSGRHLLSVWSVNRDMIGQQAILPIFMLS